MNQLRYIIPALRVTFVMGVMLALCSPPAYMVAGCCVATVTAVASWAFVRRNFPLPAPPDPLRDAVMFNRVTPVEEVEEISEAAAKLVVEVYERQQNNVIEF